jgi:hypothetical protein
MTILAFKLSLKSYYIMLSLNNSTFKSLIILNTLILMPPRFIYNFNIIKILLSLLVFINLII